jgi:hypothetical protein
MGGRKEDLITRLRMVRAASGLTVAEAVASTSGYRRKTVAELAALWNAEYAAAPKTANGKIAIIKKEG